MGACGFNKRRAIEREKALPGSLAAKCTSVSERKVGKAQPAEK
jgi:hypothetical protein